MASTGRWRLGLALWAVLHAGLYAALTPLWQAPDEPAHVEYACLVAQRGLAIWPGDADPALQQRIIQSLAANDFWARVRQPTPNPLPARFSDDPFLRNAGRQAGDESALYYLLPSLICRLPLELALQVRLMRLVSVLCFALLTVIMGWAGQAIWPGQRGPRIALMAATAGLPMLAFLAGAVNNDILAALFAGLTFGLLARWTRRPNVRLALLTLAAGLLAALAKKTAQFLVPLALLASLWSAVCWWRRQRWPLRLGSVAAALVVATLLLLPSGQPWGWSGRWQPWGGGRTPTAHAGRFGVRVVDRTPTGLGRLAQALPAETVRQLSGRTVRFGVWVRADHAGEFVRLAVQEGERATQTFGGVDPAWRWVEVTHTVSANAAQLRVVVGPGTGADESETGAVDVDDASLVVMASEDEPTQANLLRNGDMERGLAWGALLAEPLARSWQTIWPQDRPAPPDAPLARKLLYVALLFPGFWGNFGWLQVPLPLWVYALLAVLCSLAIAGLARSVKRDRYVPGTFGLAIALALIQVVAPMWQRDWQPQGRYLFPALVPLLTAFVAGLRAWSRRWGLVGALRWYVLGLLCLDAYALFGVFVPHFYGR